MKSPRVIVALSMSLVYATAFATGDGITLSAHKGPGPGDVTLEWSGGAPDFEVYRNGNAATLPDPANRLGLSGSSTWQDTPPAGPVLFYQVVSTTGGPLISRITPSRASFGVPIVVYGSGFGSNPAAVHVRFKFTDAGSGQTLSVDQPVLAASNTRLDLDVPLAMPNQTNQVQVVVGAQLSPAVPYLVGPLPDDPTPGIKGNETLTFLTKLDELSERFDARLDAWFLQTGATSQEQVDSFHQTMAQIRSAVAQLRADVASRNPNDLAAMDTIVSTHAPQLVLTKLQQGIDALSGSPLGQVLCEGRDVRDVVESIVSVLNVVDQILSAVQTAANAACGGSILLAIFTAGATTALAVTVCGVAASVNAILTPVLSAIGSVAEAADAIASAAPVDPVPGSYRTTATHALWPAEPPLVYVGGATPVQFGATSDFTNAQCPCSASFSIDVFGISIPVSIDVPAITVSDLTLRCQLAFPDGPGGVGGFVDLGAINDGATCQITGADVHNVGWVRGTYGVQVVSACGSDHPALGPASHSYLLVSGPSLAPVSPMTGQLGASIDLVGHYMPPGVVGSLVKAGASFNGALAPMYGAYADHYSVHVPDTNVISGSIALTVDGRPADYPIPFTVLPPTLDHVTPDPAFVGEQVQVRGSGFANAPSNNVLRFNGSPVTIDGGDSTSLLFTVQPGATDGPLQLTAVGVLVSNTIPLHIARWSPSARLSHPGRNAYHPVVAVRPDGTAGVAWIDRAAGGGAAHLLFTDAAPADASFRAPIEITDDLVGLPSAPQKPALAVAPDGRFHVAWVNRAGELRLASFPKGGAPSGPAGVLVASPPAGTAFRDAAIAVMPDGTIHVEATRFWLDALPQTALSDAVSTDGGATFSAFTDFQGPGIGAPFDSLLLGNADLRYANGRLWRAYTGFCDACFTSPGNLVQEIFTQSSVDGVSWTAPAPAGAGSVDPAQLGWATASRRYPTVSGDSSGAVAIWDEPNLYAYPSGEYVATRAVAGNAEPYAPAGITTLTPAAPPYQNDGGRPSLVHSVSGVDSVTAVAWIQRAPGSSPDLVAGIPRLQFNRLADRMTRIIAPVNQTPTVAPADTTSIDASPSLALDAAGRAHLVWLRGPEGQRTVRYLTTSAAAYADTLAPNPPTVPAPARHLIAVHGGVSVDGNGGVPFWGILLVDPDFPNELRWVATMPTSDNSVGLGNPSFTADRSALLTEDQATSRGANLCSLDGDTRILASDTPATDDYAADLLYPAATPDGRVLASKRFARYPGASFYVGGLVLNPAPSSAQFPRVPDIEMFTGFQHFQLSASGQWVAFRDLDYLPWVYNLTTASAEQLPNSGGSMGLAWSPAADKLAFTTSYEPCPSDASQACQALVEWDSATDMTSYRAYAEEIRGRLAYSPGGAAVAYVCNDLDCCGGTGPYSVICTTSGLMVPPAPGLADTDPAWSPDGTSIAFLRYDPTSPLPARTLMLWRIGDPAPRALTGPFMGAKFSFGSFSDTAWVTVPQ